MFCLFTPCLGFLNLGATEIVIILLIAVLLFGGRLPDVARSLGKVFFEFKRNVRDLQNDLYRTDVTTSTPRHRPEAISPKTLPEPYYPDSELTESKENEASTSEEGEDAGDEERKQEDQGKKEE